jgi:hypothetical protein
LVAPLACPPWAGLRNFSLFLFERIILVPRVLALGFVLSATEFPVEVWNTFRMSDQVLTVIVISGIGGVVLADTYGEPLLYGAMDSFIYVFMNLVVLPLSAIGHPAFGDHRWMDWSIGMHALFGVLCALTARLTLQSPKVLEG